MLPKTGPISKPDLTTHVLTCTFLCLSFGALLTRPSRHPCGATILWEMIAINIFVIGKCFRYMESL